MPPLLRGKQQPVDTPSPTAKPVPPFATKLPLPEESALEQSKTTEFIRAILFYGLLAFGALFPILGGLYSLIHG